MTRPQNLPYDIETARDAGITTIISLLERDEAAAVGLQDEGEACTTNGITFLNHPIRDMQLPEPTPFIAFAATAATRIKNGEHTALHCHASIGRSGMLTCAILAHFGFAAGSAITHTSAKRGTQIPDTDAQAAFIRRIMQA